MDTLHKEKASEFDTYSAAAEGWQLESGIPSWVPDDSTAITVRASTNEKIIEIGVITATAPEGCADAEREQMPPLTADWMPTKFPNDVLKCGDYEVMPVDGGWVGWYLAKE